MLFGKVFLKTGFKRTANLITLIHVFLFINSYYHLTCFQIMWKKDNVVIHKHIFCGSFHILLFQDIVRVVIRFWHCFIYLFLIVYFLIIFIPLPFIPLKPSSTTPRNHHIVVHIHEPFFFFLDPHPLPELSVCSLSMNLSLICLLVQFVH